jgi:cellobiose phosphorylase
LQYYSGRRLLGDHVPYPVEAYPEGGQRHLSAESGLYCRIYTEGLFGIRPVGLKSFSITPHLPEAWDYMRIIKMHGFNHLYDIDVTRESDMIRLKITSAGRVVLNKLITNGTTQTVKF